MLGNKHKNEKCLILFSGGQDSTTCLYWAKKYFKEVTAIGFDYGQTHKKELDQAYKIANKLNFIVYLPSLVEYLTDQRKKFFLYDNL